MALDAKQKNLAKRLISFRETALNEIQNKKIERNKSKNLANLDNALKYLREAAKKLKKYDNRLFTDVTTVVKSLQGDLSNSL